jgi:hypothetical protein
MRMSRWHQFRRHIALRCKVIFQHNLSYRGYFGKVMFDHEKGILDLRVSVFVSLHGGPHAHCICHRSIPKQVWSKVAPMLLANHVKTQNFSLVVRSLSPPSVCSCPCGMPLDALFDALVSACVVNVYDYRPNFRLR